MDYCKFHKVPKNLKHIDHQAKPCLVIGYNKFVFTVNYTIASMR